VEYVSAVFELKSDIDTMFLMATGACVLAGVWLLINIIRHPMNNDDSFVPRAMAVLVIFMPTAMMSWWSEVRVIGPVASLVFFTLLTIDTFVRPRRRTINSN